MMAKLAADEQGTSRKFSIFGLDCVSMISLHMETGKLASLPWIFYLQSIKPLCSLREVLHGQKVAKNCPLDCFFGQ